MCGRYYRRSDKQELAERYLRGRVPADFPLPPDFNIAPTTFQPIVRNDREDGTRELVPMRWGLIPFFANSLDSFKSFSTINARAETLQKSKTWLQPFKKRRCLVPADGFYEWAKVDPVALDEKLQRKPVKQPYAITITNGEPLAFAGLWDAWKTPEGTYLQSFSIITTAANRLMRSIHDRMPVILRRSVWDEWLDRENTERPPTHLLEPFDPADMDLAPANPAVNNARNNGEHMLIPPINSA